MTPALAPHDVAAAIDTGSVVLDVRPPQLFVAGHLPGAVNLQFNRNDLADRARRALPKQLAIIVHGEPDPVAGGAASILDGAGFEVAGFLSGGLTAWRVAGFAVETSPAIDVAEFHDTRQRYRVLDAREPFEYRYGHVPGADSFPWTDAWLQASVLARGGPLACYCATQVRSSLTASVLRRFGHDATIVLGGMTDWTDRGFPVESVQ